MFSPDEWRSSEDYLYGIDLYNFAYWWECHEVFEGLWHAVGHKTLQGNFFQALIQVAAANLKRLLGAASPADNLARACLKRLAKVPPRYMDVDVAAFSRDVRDYFTGLRAHPPLIRLGLPSRQTDRSQQTRL
ncbi:MAG: DUF309 domain-containing protein [Nitrospiraceae bacterium]